MANIQIKKGVTSVDRDTSDGSFMPARGTRDGALYTADWYDSLMLEGRCFGVNGGVLTDPIQFNGSTSATAADLTIDIPNGFLLIPLSIEVQFETMTTGVCEVFAIASSALTVSTGSALTAYNLRLDQPYVSRTTCKGAMSSNTTPYSGNRIEFMRMGYPTDMSLTTTPQPNFRWSARNQGPGPMIVDGGSISVFAGGTASTGFITVTWVELPENFIK